MAKVMELLRAQLKKNVSLCVNYLVGVTPTGVGIEVNFGVGRGVGFGMG